MIKLRRQKSRQTSRKPASSKGNWRQKVLHTFDITLICLTAAVIFYMALFVVKVSSGYSKTRQTPDQIIRLQVVNGSGDGVAMKNVLMKLNSLSDINLDIELVDNEEFKLRLLPKSFIISRVFDLKSANMLAGRLGMDDSEVIYKPMENNDKQITATLVLGEDAGSRFLIDQEKVGG